MFNFSAKKMTNLLLALCFSASSFAGLITLGNGIVDIVQQGGSSITSYSGSRLGGSYTYAYTHNLNDNNFELGTAIYGRLNINFVQTARSSFDTSLFSLAFHSIRFTVEEFDVGSSLAGNDFNYLLKPDVLAALNHDGYLDITLTSSRYFQVTDSTLGIDIGYPIIFDFGESITLTAVPEPSTLALIFVGLVGLCFNRYCKNPRQHIKTTPP